MPMARNSAMKSGSMPTCATPSRLMSYVRRPSTLRSSGAPPTGAAIGYPTTVSDRGSGQGRPANPLKSLPRPTALDGIQVSTCRYAVKNSRAPPRNPSGAAMDVWRSRGATMPPPRPIAATSSSVSSRSLRAPRLGGPGQLSVPGHDRVAGLVCQTQRVDHNRADM